MVKLHQYLALFFYCKAQYEKVDDIFRLISIRGTPPLAHELEITMNNYRLYFLTKVGGHIEHYEAIEAKGDGAAIEAAKLYRGRYPLELWQRDRRVEAFPAQMGLVPAPYGH